MAYIYQITNDVNGKIYIGKTEFSIEKRFQEHCKDSKKQTEEHRPLYAAMRKYGVEHFHIELLEETDNSEERERYWIEAKGSFKNGYNATIGGDGRRYLDYDLICKVYEQTLSVIKTAEIIGCDKGQVGRILDCQGVKKLPFQYVMKRAYGHCVAKCDRKTGEILEVFPSINEAALSIGKERAHIKEVVNGKRKSAYGFIWKAIQRPSAI